MNRLTDEEFAEKMREREERSQELAPLLGKLLGEAKATYATLRPRAQHVSEVDRAFPLRHQQVHAFAFVMGVGMVPIADYLMIRMRENDNITVRKDVSEGNVRWSIDHSRQIAPLMVDETKISETGRNSRLGGYAIDLRTGIYEYPHEWGVNSQFRSNPCHFFDNFPNAEERIEAVSIDLRTALEQNS